MTATILFYIIIGIIIINFIIDKTLDVLNAKHFYDEPAEELADVYDQKAYKKAQEYKNENFRFGNLTSLFSISTTLLFFFLDGFRIVDDLARSVSENSIVIALIFFGIISFASDLINIPFSYYRTFVIEEKYGFNKSTKSLFWIDKLKGWLMMIFIGGLIVTLVVWFYQETANYFWLYAWGLIALFMLFMNMFYSTLIVPLFNKQTPLEDGVLKQNIEIFAKSVNFKLDNIYVIDGSKRSSKANAYFAGFGSTKRIVLFDTLINDLSTEEIIAVLAHEVGHYKKKHTLFNLFTSVLLTGLTLFILSFFISDQLLSEALGVSTPSFHVGIVAFAILYSPISEITGLLMNIISRKFEYQADDFAKEHYGAQPLISSLKKLSKNSLSNLTPHWAYVFVHYSHPTLRERILNLSK